MINLLLIDDYVEHQEHSSGMKGTAEGTEITLGAEIRVQTVEVLGPVPK
jgi:hypothetical protein